MTKRERINKVRDYYQRGIICAQWEKYEILCKKIQSEIDLAKRSYSVYDARTDNYDSELYKMLKKFSGILDELLATVKQVQEIYVPFEEPLAQDIRLYFNSEG